MEETIDMLSIIFGEKNVIARNPIKCLVYNTFHAKNTFVHFDCHKNLVKDQNQRKYYIFKNENFIQIPDIIQLSEDFITLLRAFLSYFHHYMLWHFIAMQIYRQYLKSTNRLATNDRKMDYQESRLDTTREDGIIESKTEYQERRQINKIDNGMTDEKTGYQERRRATTREDILTRETTT